MTFERTRKLYGLDMSEVNVLPKLIHARIYGLTALLDPANIFLDME